MANYDTTIGLPYIRVSEVAIRDYGNGNISIEYFEKEALLDANNKVHHLTDVADKYVLDLSQITEPVQAVDPATGADIPGLTFTKQQVFLGILAFIRADQKRRTEVVNE